MKVYKIFPDYCSTGVWNGAGRKCELPDYFPQEFHIALKYWQRFWEYVLTQDDVDPYYWSLWQEDGRILVLRMNQFTSAHRLPFKFEYCVERCDE